MQIELSDHFTYKKLLRFTFPMMMMLLFISIYGVVDGFFVSNYAGKTPYSALNLIYPIVQVFSALGFMMGSGGAAIVGKTLGEGDGEKAKKRFSLVFLFTIVLGVLSSVIGYIITPACAELFGSDEGEMMEACITYGRINFVGITFAMLQYFFQMTMATAGKPDLGFKITVLSGITNMILDWVWVGLLDGGIAAAAWATVASQVVGAVIPVIYFLRPNDSLLSIGKTKYDGKVLLKAMTNGSSEFIGNIAASVVAMLYNTQLLKYSGEDGVAAYGSIMYISFIFCAIFFGYCGGTAPIVSYNFGAKNTKELQNVFKKSIVVIGTLGFLMTASSMIFARQFTELFVGYDRALTELTLHGMYIFNIIFLVMGFNCFSSSFFTALNNGLISAILAFSRTFVISCACILIFPEIWGIEGIWWSIPAAEGLAFIVSITFLVTQRKKYNYF